MAFGLFKKEETLDLTKKRIDSDVPTEGYFKRKGKIPSSSESSALSSNAIQSSQDITPTTSTSPAQSTQSSGGFFNFFGSSSSDNSSSTTSSNSAISPSSYYSNNSSSSSTIDTDKLKTQLDDLLYRFSRLADRVELLEKKMDRVERKGE